MQMSSCSHELVLFGQRALQASARIARPASPPLLQIPKYNLEYSKKSFSYTVLKVWNKIPIKIRELPTLHQHKKQLKFIY